jgi:hypothetical protein
MPVTVVVLVLPSVTDTDCVSAPLPRLLVPKE